MLLFTPQPCITRVHITYTAPCPSLFRSRQSEGPLVIPPPGRMRDPSHRGEDVADRRRGFDGGLSPTQRHCKTARTSSVATGPMCRQTGAAPSPRTPQAASRVFPGRDAWA